MANVSVSKNYIPQIDYVSRDYTAILADLTAIAKQFNPTWVVSDPADLGYALLETFAYLGDILSFYTDRMASEGFLGTASQRSSVLQIASMLGYTPTPSSAATVSLSLYNNNSSGSLTIPAGTQVASTTLVNGQSTQVVFELDNSVTISAGASVNTTATQGVTTTDESLGTSNGTPSQSFKISQANVVINSSGSNIIVKVGGIAYTYSSSLVDNSQYDSVFTTTMDADGYTYVVFGDGVGGKIPPATYDIKVTYRVGVGALGNIALDSLSKNTLTGSYNVTVTQLTTGTGGADAESTDSIRINAPRALRTLRRAVSLKDYSYLALQVSGVSKANADAATWSNVNLYVAPFGSSAVNTYGPFTNITSINTINGYIPTQTPTGTTNITLSTLEPHYIQPGQSVVVSGVTPSGYNGTWTAQSGTTGTTLVLNIGSNPGAITAAGTLAVSGYLRYEIATTGLVTNQSYVTITGCVPNSYDVYTPTLVAYADDTGFVIPSSLTSFPGISNLTYTTASVSVTGGNTTAFDSLSNDVVSYFTDKVAPNVTLNVKPPTYVPVNINLTLHVLPQYTQSTVVTQVQNALSNLVSYNNSFFADRITPHFILNSITNIDGVDYASVDHLRKNANEQKNWVSYYTRTATTAKLVFPNTHNITAGQNITVSGVAAFDGTYAVNSTTSNSVTITVPAGTATPTGITTNSSTASPSGAAVINITNASTSGILPGMYVTGTNVPTSAYNPAVVLSVSTNSITISVNIATTIAVNTALTFSWPPTSVLNSANVITVDSTTSNGVTTYGVVCAANEIPIKGTFTITATGGLV
jgi:hypothetical protein